jgi:type II secretory pathway predicted ATPase ExeA
MYGVTSILSIEDRLMLSDVLEHFGLSKSLRQVNDFETDHHRQLLKDLKVAIHEGGIIALTGILGSGKTVFLGRLQEHLRQEGQIEVAESLTFDVPRVNLDTLKLALYYDLATDKDGDLPSKTEKSERALMKVMRRCQKPIVLFVDDGHDLHGQTLRGLKQLIEKTSRRGARRRRKPAPGPPCLSLKASRGISVAISPGFWNNARLLWLPRTS